MNAVAQDVRGLRLAEGVILAALTLALAAGLAVLLGPNGLQVLRYQPEWPVVGDDAYVMRVETRFDDGTRVVVEGVPQWRNTEAGTVDAATGGRPVEVTGPYSGWVGFAGPSATQRWLWVLGQSALPTLAAVALYLIFRIVRSARVGDPFVRANVSRLRALAVVVGIGGLIVSAYAAWLRRWLLDGSGAAGLVAQDWTVSFLPLVAGVVVGVLAEVWRRGVAMREDLEGLV